MNFSENAVLSYDVRTKSIRVVDQGITSYYAITSKGGVTIEYSNNHLNINGFGLTIPFSSTHVYIVNPPFIPYIEWDKVKKELIVGTRTTEIDIQTPDDIGSVVTTGHFIGVDPRRGNFAIKISMLGKELKVEQGLVSGMES